MEKRLIDANALKRAFCNHCDGDEPCAEPCVDIGLIETAPTVDAVPVVRCKECEHYDGKWCSLLDMVNSNMGDWFCAYGERRSDEQQSKG